MEERLQKVLARAGLASRRAAEKMILAGRVRVNGEVIDQLGAKADPERDRIEVDGRPIRTGTPRLYFMFNKPAGFLTTMGDPKGRPTVAGFLAGLGPGIFPVGRLDMDTEGLLILTNDGELAARLMHPRYHVPKTYRVKVEGHPSGRTLASLADGELMIGDRPAAPAEVEVIKRGTDRTWLKITLIEGRRRQVRRMCSAVGHPVMKLKRIAYGPLSLGRLASGGIRSLGPGEVRALEKSAGLEDGKPIEE